MPARALADTPAIRTRSPRSPRGRAVTTEPVYLDVQRGFGVDARVVGRVEQSAGKKGLTIKSTYGTFQY